MKYSLCLVRRVHIMCTCAHMMFVELLRWRCCPPAACCVLQVYTTSLMRSSNVLRVDCVQKNSVNLIKILSREFLKIAKGQNSARSCTISFGRPLTLRLEKSKQCKILHYFKGKLKLVQKLNTILIGFALFFLYTVYTKYVRASHQRHCVHLQLAARRWRTATPSQ